MHRVWESLSGREALELRGKSLKAARDLLDDPEYVALHGAGPKEDAGSKVESLQQHNADDEVPEFLRPGDVRRVAPLPANETEVEKEKEVPRLKDPYELFAEEDDGIDFD